jgi:hypothetical protein
MSDMNRDAEIFGQWVAGERIRDIAKVFKCGTDVVLQTIDKFSITIDDDFRRRLVSREIERLQVLHNSFFGKAKSGDVIAAQLCLRIAERFASLVGIDSATKLDVKQLTSTPQENSTDRIMAALNRVRYDPAYGGRPDADDHPSPDDDDPSSPPAV